jgi:hypothetical protein
MLMDVEVALGIACVAVVVVVLVRQRPGRSSATVKTGLFTVGAAQTDQTSVNIRDATAGRDIRLRADKIDAEKVDAGRDLTAETSKEDRGGPLA